MSVKRETKYLFEDFRIDIDPDKIDESVKNLQERLRRMVDQGRYTKVRLKYKGKALMPDIPFGIFMATEVASFWYGGLFRALVVNLGVKTFIEVELIHQADEKVREGIELYMNGEIESAEDKYREALKMKPGDVSALYNLGILLRVTGRRDEAMKALEEAAAAGGHPDADRAKEALEKMNRGPRTL
jgi:tetratricopeptide (TPR) repeat protein